MNLSLKLIALFSLVGISGAAAAETAGLNLPAFASAEAGLSLFVVALALLTFGSDYAYRPALRPARRARVLLPAADAFASRSVATPNRRSPRVVRAFKPTVTL